MEQGLVVVGGGAVVGGGGVVVGGGGVVVGGGEGVVRGAGDGEAAAVVGTTAALDGAVGGGAADPGFAPDEFDPVDRGTVVGEVTGAILLVGVVTEPVVDAVEGKTVDFVVRCFAAWCNATLPWLGPTAL
jgi:hypothetical protein